VCIKQRMPVAVADLAARRVESTISVNSQPLPDQPHHFRAR
jgi:hypothetical protein